MQWHGFPASGAAGGLGLWSCSILLWLAIRDHSWAVMGRPRAAAWIRRSHRVLAGVTFAGLSQTWKKPELSPSRLLPLPGDQKNVFHKALPENIALSSAQCRGSINGAKWFLPEPILRKAIGKQEVLPLDRKSLSSTFLQPCPLVARLCTMQGTDHGV